MASEGPKGAFVSWDGGCLFIGSGGGLVPVHAHYAIQVAFGTAPGIRFRADERDDWREFAGAVIASQQPHAMDATMLEHWAVLFVEPETPEGRALGELLGREGMVEVPARVPTDAAPELFGAWIEERGLDAVRDAARGVVRAAAGGIEPSVTSDERILRATSYIRAHLDRSLTLDEVAQEACLSPSRFRHLFVEQTGMALRPYILWRRFLRVWELLMGGATLSAAAHAAGFADAAHLTRTSKRMFGFPPSGMVVGDRE